MVKAIVNKEAQLELVDGEEQTPFDIAVAQGHEEVASWLLAQSEHSKQLADARQEAVQPAQFDHSVAQLATIFASEGIAYSDNEASSGEEESKGNVV